MSTITRETISAGRLQESGHLNYGPNGFGYSMQHTTIPRLSCIDRHYKGAALKKAGTSSARLWQVDGLEVADLDEAVARLAEPPVFTAVEQTFLVKVPVEWTELHPFLKAMASEVAEPDTPYGLIFVLRHKGAIQIERREAVKASFVRRRPPEQEPQA